MKRERKSYTERVKCKHAQTLKCICFDRYFFHSDREPARFCLTHRFPRNGERKRENPISLALFFFWFVNYSWQKFRRKTTVTNVKRLTNMDDQVNDMIDIAEADRDALLVRLKDDDSLNDDWRIVAGEGDDENNLISKHFAVVFFTDDDDDDETEWCADEPSWRWHVSKQEGRWP